MSERGSFRGGGGGRGRGGGYGRGGQRGGGAGGGAYQQQPHQQQQQQQEKPKKENILDLSKLMDKEVKVKFSGGREGMFLYSYFPCVYICGCVMLIGPITSDRNAQRLRSAHEPGPG